MLVTRYFTISDDIRIIYNSMFCFRAHPHGLVISIVLTQPTILPDDRKGLCCS